MPSTPARIFALPAPAPRLAVWVMGLLALPLIFIGIGQYGVVGSDEAFYQDIALGMLQSGNYFELRSGSSVYIYDAFANAPLQYWARAFVVSWLGKSMLSMRLLSALSAVLTVLVTYRLTLYLAGRGAAFASGLILLTTFQFLYLHSGRTGELEPSVCLLLVGSAYLFIKRLDDPSRGWWLHHLLIALLFNLKAPTVFIPIAAELICFALMPRARTYLGGWLKTGLLILPIGSAWHLYCAVHYSDYVMGVLAAVQHQAAGEFAMGPSGGIVGRAFYYAEKFLFGSFPHVLLYPMAIFGALGIGRTFKEEEPARRDGIRVVLVYSLTVLAFYLGISKVGPWYIVHAYPFLATLVGLFLFRISALPRQPTWLLIGFSVVLSLLFWLEPEMWNYNPFGRDAYAIAMPTSWRTHLFVDPLAGTGILAGILLGCLLISRHRFGSGLSNPLALGAFVIFVSYGILRGLLPLAYIDHLSPAAALHAEMENRVAAGEEIPFPVDVPRTHPWVANYYFYRDFRMRVLTDNETGAAYRKPTQHLLLGWKPGRNPTAQP